MWDNVSTVELIRLQADLPCPLWLVGGGGLGVEHYDHLLMNAPGRSSTSQPAKKNLPQDSVLTWKLITSRTQSDDAKVDLFSSRKNDLTVIRSSCL